MTFTYETVNILLLLVPGFISTRILDTIIHRKEQEISATLFEALTFSFAIYALANLFIEWKPIFHATKQGELAKYEFSTDGNLIIIITILTIIVPTTIGAILHHDLILKLFRVLHITDKTSRDTTWQDVFVEQKRFVVIHLKDGRRIYGWPMYYSNDPIEGFIYLFQPAWIADHGKYIECGTHGMLIQLENIDFIEFMKEESETKGS